MAAMGTKVTYYTGLPSNQTSEKVENLHKLHKIKQKAIPEIRNGLL
jgi:hypothetical protein